MIRIAVCIAALLVSTAGYAHTFCATDVVSLQNAFDQSADPLAYGNENNTVNIALGTYATGAAAFHFLSSASGTLTVQGGWNTDCSAQTYNATLTVLDGHHATQVMSLGSTQAAISVYNLTIQNGEYSNDGGGLFVSATNSGAEVRDQLSNIIFRDNHSARYGGGFYFQTTGTTRSYVLTSLMVGNSADLGYGAGYVVRDSVNGTIIDNNTVTRNTTLAPGGSGGVGYNNLGTAGFGFGDIEDNIFWGNTSSSFACVGGCAAVTFDDDDYDAVEGSVGFGIFNPDISADPQFRDPDNGDFRLSGNSPCLAFATFRIAGYDLDAHYGGDGAQQTVADLGAYMETIFSDGFDGPLQPPQ
jgi:hypothetical protein